MQNDTSTSQSVIYIDQVDQRIAFFKRVAAPPCIKKGMVVVLGGVMALLLAIPIIVAPTIKDTSHFAGITHAISDGNASGGNYIKFADTSTAGPSADPSTAPNTFYVSMNGSGTDGRSWSTAWKNTSSINWATVPSGATIFIDGGSSICSVSPYDFQPSSPNPGVNCGQRYSVFSIGQDNISLKRATETGRNGTVVIDGGRDIPLPYCHQISYSAPTGAAVGIDFAGHSGVTINGMTRSGIIIRGTQNGVQMATGSNNTLRNMELFDNGYPIPIAAGYNSDGNNILMGGRNNTYDRLLIHDGGQDQFHSDSSGYSEAGSKVINSWMGAMREHPIYPGEPFNDLQAVAKGCTHADGLQIFAPGTTMSGLTIDHDVFGPGVNQGLYSSDRKTGTTFNDVVITNSLFLDVAGHNIITDNPVNGWILNRVTLFATQGGFEISGNGTNTMTNTIKYGGYVYTPGGTWTASGNIWYSGDSITGARNTNPNFVGPIPSGTLPSFASLRKANLTPQCSGCSGKGSPITSFNALMSYIDSLN